VEAEVSFHDEIIKAARSPVLQAIMESLRDLLLEGRTKIETIMFTEGDMARYPRERTAEANALMQKRQARRAQVSNRTGLAWRGSRPPERDR